jgi:hypothetical protein
MIDSAEEVLAKQFFTTFEQEILKDRPEYFKKELERRVFIKIRDLFDKTGRNVPSDLNKFGSFRKVKNIIEDASLTTCEAMLTPIRGGFIIKYDPKVPETRQRFSIAHEIGHTFFFDLNVDDQTMPQKTFKSFSKTEEKWANLIAGEILTPEPYFYKSVLEFGKKPSIYILKNLKLKFKVSLEVLIKRLLYDAPKWNQNIWKDDLWECFIVIGEENKENKIRLSFYRSPNFQYKLTFLTRNRILELMNKILSQNKEGTDEKKPEKIEFSKRTCMIINAKGEIKIMEYNKIKYRGEVFLISKKPHKRAILLITIP